MRTKEKELEKLPVILVTPRQREIVDKAVARGYFPTLSEFVRQCINKFEDAHHLTEEVDTFTPSTAPIEVASH